MKKILYVFNVRKLMCDVVCINLDINPIVRTVGRFMVTTLNQH